MPPEIPLSALFHQHSKKARGAIPADENQWPQEWKTTQYKSYPRFEKISLNDVALSADFFELIKRRKSQRDFSRRSINKEQISTLLHYACGVIDQSSMRRAHPSAGSRYPLEYYPLVFVSSDVPSGLYHYDIKNHALEILQQRDLEEEHKTLFTYPWASQASLAIVITACFARMQNKYSERGYRNILLEAGHVGQNLSLVAEALGLRSCAMAGTRDETLEKIIDIDGVTESVVYTLLFG
jgi:SagB-type dehydrogenase family enzyme